jgi:hypothetical protein
MGLKSGSRDAGLDKEDAEEATEEQSADDDAESGMAEQEATTASEAEAPGASTQADSGRLSMDSIPYKLRRDKVNEGRQQVPYFLRDAVIEAEEELQDALEAMLDEDVYKSDYREAAMVVAQRNPELVAEVLREWGYDLD